MKPRVLATRKLPDQVEARLVASYDTTLNPTDVPLSADELSSAMGEFDAILPTVSDRLDAALLQSPNRRVRMIANIGVGFSNIDIDEAHGQGIFVSNTPDVLTEATADIAVLLILAATRGAYGAERKLRESRWHGFSIVEGLGISIQGKVLGVIGMGRIGQATARRAALGFGMEVVYFNRSPVGDLGFEAQSMETIDDVMAMADVVSVHVPGGGSAPLVTAGHIAAMKPTAYLVNTARGDSIDQNALVQALVDGKIAGAGLDVFNDEPHVPDQLRRMENVTLLPHIGSATTEVRTAMGMMAVDNLEAFFLGHPLPNAVVPRLTN
ncbi:D-glycerate dehydrogenase [Jannaschia sp. EhC01]|nr:D-glycerate dehydrogenase [Jannaschia sp. EhC01]